MTDSSLKKSFFEHFHNFSENGMGQRVVKIDRPAQGSHETQTIYIRDASGNVMAVYEYIVQKPGGVFDPNAFMEYRLDELHIYGSSRLGLLLVDKVLESNGMAHRSMPATLGKYSHWIAGNKRYELTNHLGNVLSVVSDRKIGHSQFNTLYFSYYTPDIRTATDYYPFGWAMPGRQVTGEYRYGFNGQEKVDEISGAGNHNTAMFWEYDTRTGRRWNQDPRPNPSISNYATFGNNPIIYSDLLGDTLRAVNEVSAERSLGIFHNSFNSVSIARSLFSLAEDGITFNSINKSDMRKAMGSLSADEKILFRNYVSLINEDNTNVIEVVKLGESLSGYGRNVPDFPKNANDLNMESAGGQFGQAYYDGNIVKKGGDGHYVGIVENATRVVTGYSDGVFRPSLPGELMAHEWGHAMGARKGRNHMDSSIQMGNAFLRSKGFPYFRKDHGDNVHSKGFDPNSWNLFINFR